MHYAYLDEFGGVSQAIEHDRHLIIAALVTDTPRQLDLLTTRARRRFDVLGAIPELKATHSSEKITRWMLSKIARLDVALLVVVQDKKDLSKFPKAPEDLYRQIAAHTVRLCVERWPLLEVVLDKRYTQQHLRTKLEWQIRQCVTDIPEQAVVIRQVESQREKGIQVVDFVAWAAGQKYQRGDNSYLEMLAKRMFVEARFEAK